LTEVSWTCAASWSRETDKDSRRPDRAWVGDGGNDDLVRDGRIVWRDMKGL